MLAIAYFMMLFSTIFIVIGMAYWWHLRSRRLEKEKTINKDKVRVFYRLKR